VEKKGLKHTAKKGGGAKLLEEPMLRVMGQGEGGVENGRRDHRAKGLNVPDKRKPQRVKKVRSDSDVLSRGTPMQKSEKK